MIKVILFARFVLFDKDPKKRKYTAYTALITINLVATDRVLKPIQP
jgi:hypothetical protein